MSFIIYKQTADLRKLQRDAVDADLEGYTTIYHGLKINIQPAGLEYVATLPDGAMGKTFMAYTTHSGAQNGMEIMTSGTTTVSGMRYQVIGRQEWVGPLGKHYELILKLKTN